MSDIGPETRWIDALRSEAAIFDRLATHDARIGRFADVLNDARVAATLEVADVARMLGLEVEVLLAIAAGAAPDGTAAADLSAEPPAAWLAPGVRQRTLDLRPVFERGQAPLAMILDEVERLPPGADLVIEAPFHPLPLRRLLGGRGFDSRAHRLSDVHWRVTFRQTWAPRP